MKAQSALVLIGLIAGTGACRGALEPDPKPAFESFVDPRLLWLARHQNGDGSWGTDPVFLGDSRVGPPGITALAVAAFLDAGYTHLSKDDNDGIRFGDVVKRGVKWLISALAPDGSFPADGDPALHQFLATWALSEAYGMTGTMVFKVRAQLAADALGRGLFADPPWEHESRAGWAALALYSVKESELEGEWETLIQESRKSLEPAIASKDRLQAAAAWVILGGRKIAPDLKPLAGSIVSKPFDGTHSNLVTLFFGASILHLSEAVDNATWTSRLRDLLRSLSPSMEGREQESDGDAGASAIKVSLASLTLHATCRYPTSAK